MLITIWSHYLFECMWNKFVYHYSFYIMTGLMFVNSNIL